MVLRVARPFYKNAEHLDWFAKSRCVRGVPAADGLCVPADGLLRRFRARDSVCWLQIVLANPGGGFAVPAGDLSFSVIVFSACACTTLGTLVLRRMVLGYELGGTPAHPTEVPFCFHRHSAQRSNSTLSEIESPMAGLFPAVVQSFFGPTVDGCKNLFCCQRLRDFHAQTLDTVGLPW